MAFILTLFVLLLVFLLLGEPNLFYITLIIMLTSLSVIFWYISIPVFLFIIIISLFSK